MVSLGAILFPFNVPGTPYGRLTAISSELESQLRKLIGRRRAQPAGSDLLSTFIRTHDEDGSSFSDDELLGLSSLIVSAGYDTTAYTLTWTLFLLSQHSKVLGKLRGKLRGEPPTAAQLAELPLLEWVIKESMRVLSCRRSCFSALLRSASNSGATRCPKGRA